MKRAVILVLILSLCISFCACGASAPEPTPETTPEPTPTPFMDNTAAINEAASSVVKLNCFDKRGELIATGSGFAAFEDGIIVTNYHVIEDRVFSITAELESGMFFNIDWIIAYDEAKDIAILKTNTKTGLQLLPVGASADAVKGEKIVAIGYPLGLGNTVSTGVISSIYEEDGERIIQFSAPISHGSSGGALFNEKGEVIGVTYASFVDGQNLNLAVPIEEAQKLWNGKAERISLADYQKSKVMSVEDLLNDIDNYIGQEVTIGGYVSIVYTNGVCIMDSPENVVSETYQCEHTCSSLVYAFDSIFVLTDTITNMFSFGEYYSFEGSISKRVFSGSSAMDIGMSFNEFSHLRNISGMTTDQIKAATNGHYVIMLSPIE